MDQLAQALSRTQNTIERFALFLATLGYEVRFQGELAGEHYALIKTEGKVGFLLCGENCHCCQDVFSQDLERFFYEACKVDEQVIQWFPDEGTAIQAFEAQGDFVFSAPGLNRIFHQELTTARLALAV
jgi:hypothetical protein